MNGMDVFDLRAENTPKSNATASVGSQTEKHRNCTVSSRDQTASKLFSEQYRVKTENGNLIHDTSTRGHVMIPNTVRRYL